MSPPSSAEDGLRSADWPRDPEIHHHLHFRPYIVLDVAFDPRPMLREALALLEHFVAHRYADDASAGPPAWKSLALQAQGGDARRTEHSTSSEPYSLTPIAERCPATMRFLRSLTDLSQCGRVRFMLLEPGGHIPIHADFEDRLFPAGLAVNISLNMPAGCRFVADTRPDGTPTPYTVEVPFSDAGSVVLFNNAKHHTVVNESALPRVHVIFHGPLRLSNESILADARRQNGLASDAEVLRAILWKKAELGELVDPPADLCDAVLEQRRIVGMWPPSVRLLLVDTVIGDDAELRRECLHKISAASLYPLAFDVVAPGEVDGWLRARLAEPVSHVAMVGSGTFVERSEDFVLAVLRAISELARSGAVAAGHLIDRMPAHGNLPYLHEQFAILDVARWNACGKPRFAPMYGADTHDFPGYAVRGGHVHDDYTPLAIEPDPAAPRSRGAAWWGSRVIAAALEHGGTVVNLPASLRAAKRFAYPNLVSREHHAEVRRGIERTLGHVRGWVYCLNNEPPLVPRPRGFRPERLVSVAAGLKWLAILQQYAGESAELSEVCFVDYSANALEYVSAIQRARDYDALLATVYEFSQRNPAYRPSRDEIRGAVDAFVAECFGGSRAALLARLAAIRRSECVALDFVEQPEGLLRLVDPARRSVFWHSNAWNSHAILYRLYPEQIESNYEDLLRRVQAKLGMRGFRRRGCRLAVFGESREAVHTLFTDGDASAWSDYPDDWLAL